MQNETCDKGISSNSTRYPGRSSVVTPPIYNPQPNTIVRVTPQTRSLTAILIRDYYKNVMQQENNMGAIEAWYWLITIVKKLKQKELGKWKKSLLFFKMAHYFVSGSLFVFVNDRMLRKL